MSKHFIGYRKEDILRKCGSELTLKEIQNRLLQMMIAFDDFCRKNNLKYCMIYGTLLGAVRHKGFIPWDDDVDFYMPREDYEKLMSFSELNRDFELINLNHHRDYYYPYAYGNIVDKHTLMVANNMKLCTGKGLSIDILPVDLLPENTLDRKKLINKILTYRRLIDLLHSRRFSTGGLKMKLKKTIAFFLKPINEDIILKKIDRLAKSTKKTENTVESMQMVLATPRIYPYRFFTDPIELEFCGKKFYAPENYDSMLTEMYGDYMTPPPEKDRYNHNMHVYLRKM